MGFWLMTSVTGELDDLSFYGREYEYRELIDATDSRVISPENPYKDLEYIVRAREGSKTADIIIVNHSLLLTDTMDSEGASRILPKIESLVLDEVHNLESVATESLKEKLDIDSFERTISEVERYIKKYNKAHPSDSFIFPEAREQAEGMMLAVSLFFEELEIYFLDVQSQNTGGYGGGRQQDILIEAPFYTTDRLERLQ